MTLEPPASTTDRARNGLLLRLTLTAAAGVTAAWLWACWCVFPGSSWNDLRLAPAFALARGVPVYPGPSAGVINTWTYGPLPLLSLLPATWATRASQALAIAGGLNLATSLGAILLVCACWPSPRGHSLPRTGRLLVGILTILVWPRATFQFLQADNLAVALGLVGSLLLINARTATARWGAALGTVAMLACKQTSGGLVLAQIVWLWLAVSRREAMDHAIRCFVCGTAVAGLMVAGFGWRRLWFNLVYLPSRFPWVPDPWQRVRPMVPELAVHVLLPAAVLLVFYRSIWRRDSPLLLPALAWLCTIPPGLAALLKLGGTINSIESFQLWLTPTLLAGCAWAQSRRHAATLFLGLSGAALAIGGLRLAQRDAVAWRPVTAQYAQADYLARTFPGQIWFACNPLVTIYSDRQFYHDEDGLHMRLVAGAPPRLGQLYAHLPRQLGVIALPRGVYTWGIAEQVGPAHKKRDVWGDWILYSWPPGTPLTAAPPSHG